MSPALNKFVFFVEGDGNCRDTNLNDTVEPHLMVTLLLQPVFFRSSETAIHFLLKKPVNAVTR